MRAGAGLAFLLGLALASEVCQTRTKRYLAFPDKSNLALTITLLKPTAFMNGVNTLHEIDLGVPLPRSPHRLRRAPRGPQHRALLYAQIEAALDLHGLSGAGCLDRIMCEVQKIKQVHLVKSIVLQVLHKVFTLEGVNFSDRKTCDDYCPLSLFHPSLLS